MSSVRSSLLSSLIGIGVLALIGLGCAGGGSGGSTGSGGATGTGGTTGTGGAKGGTTGTGGATGAGGRGGATGAGGSTGGVTGTGGITTTGGTTGSGGTGTACVGCKVTVAAYCQSGGDTQTIRLTVDVGDGATAALPLSAVTFRYWFVLGETTDPPVLAIDYAQMFQDHSEITSTFVPVSPAVTGANEYLEVGFTSAAPTLSLFGDTGQIQLQFHGMNDSSSFDLDQEADYSYQACGDAAATTFVNTSTITGYINGVLAWGKEPK